MVAAPFGPEIGMVSSAFPDAPLVSTLPVVNVPAFIGSPSSAWTSALACARARASLYTSDDFRAPKTNTRRSVMLPPQANSGVRQPTGTTHFQLRAHQVG